MSKPKTKHSMLGYYDVNPAKERIAVVDIDDPMHNAAHARAVLLPGPEGAVSGDGPRIWETPVRLRLEVIGSIRDDVAMKMHARRQIDDACFMAARRYQEIYETAAAVRLKSIDQSMPPISGGAGSDAMDAQRDAVRAMRSIEGRLGQRFGGDGVKLMRDVLGSGMTIEHAARNRGDATKHDIGWWGSFFRRCLRLLAEILGFAVAGAYRNRARVLAKAQRKRDATRHSTATLRDGRQ